MALTIVRVNQQDLDDGEKIIADVTFDSSYPHGGEAITADDLGFRAGTRLDQVVAVSDGPRTTQFVPDASLADRGKLLVRDLVPPSQDFIMNLPLVAIGTVSAAEIKITNAVVFMGNGATAAELAAAEHAFTATTHDITADADTAQEAYYLLSTVDGAAVVVTKGTTADVGTAVPPAVPANAAPIGLVLIVVAAGSTDFDATSDDLDAAHLTTTFEDLDRQVYQATDLSAFTTRVVAYGR